MRSVALFFARGLLEAAIAIVAAIGRWVIQRIAKRGATRILNYMRERVTVFWNRHKKAKTQLRRSWLMGRIGRWMRAIRWIEETKLKLRKAVARELDGLLSDKPIHVSDEDFDAWAKRGGPIPAPLQ